MREGSPGFLSVGRDLFHHLRIDGVIRSVVIIDKQLTLRLRQSQLLIEFPVFLKGPQRSVVKIIDLRSRVKQVFKFLPLRVRTGQPVRSEAAKKPRQNQSEQPHKGGCIPPGENGSSRGPFPDSRHACERQKQQSHLTAQAEGDPEQECGGQTAEPEGDGALALPFPYSQEGKNGGRRQQPGRNRILDEHQMIQETGRDQQCFQQIQAQLFQRFAHGKGSGRPRREARLPDRLRFPVSAGNHLHSARSRRSAHSVQAPLQDQEDASRLAEPEKGAEHRNAGKHPVQPGKQSGQGPQKLGGQRLRLSRVNAGKDVPDQHIVV